MDVNQNGNASLAEFEGFCHAHAKEVQRDSKEIFRFLDLDHDGALMIKKFINRLLPTIDIIEQHKALTKRADVLQRAGIDMSNRRKY